MSDDERKFLFSLIIHNFAKNNRTLIAVCIDGDDDDTEILNLKFLIRDSRNDVWEYHLNCVLPQWLYVHYNILYECKHTSWIIMKEKSKNDLKLLKLLELKVYNSKLLNQPPNSSMCTFQCYTANNNYN